MSADDVLPEAEVHRLEVFTGAGRRRQWTTEAKARIVPESYASSVGGCGRAVRPSQHAGIHLAPEGARHVDLSFTPVMVTSEETVATGDAGIIEVRIGDALVRIPRDANAALAGAAISALTGSR